MVRGENLYLKESVQVEPLFNRWHAWILMVPPVTAALNLLERYLKIMQSYVNSPALHAAAVKNPAMRGGPFIDLGVDYVPEVRDLILETQSRNSKLLEFARAIKQLSQLLAERARGEAMETLYAEVPDVLKGYVELCYDLNHNPSFRFFESLVYRSEYYREAEASQSFELTESAEDGGRPFILSTPRLRSQKAVSLNLPFSSPQMDGLYRMRRRPRSYEAVRDAFGIEIDNEPLFQSFFTTDAPKPYAGYDGDSFRIRYFGHACLLIESKKVRILIDPIVSSAANGGVPRFTYSDLPDEIDFLLITHSHHDHAVVESLVELRSRVKTVVVGRNYDGFIQDPSLQLVFEHLGFQNVREIRDMQEIPIPDGAIVGIPFLGEHHDLLMQSRTGYLIRIGGSSVLCIADSCNIEPKLYEHLLKSIGGADILFLGMECDGAPPAWIYGPLFPEPLPREINLSRRARGSNFNEARAIVDAFNFKQVYVYAMGQEPWVNHILDNEFTDASNPVMQSRQLVDECRSRGIVADCLFGKKEIRP
ncbi:MAG TPA: MBL fold metallo-hydrolase [Blastocatellia bacterium]|jgi:L-ascorbate metabolism protein UlaG (beta-lactamase superfamily)|nr:MBL fold metallo-hydrolase [Blastocatellia bacterium]